MPDKDGGGQERRSLIVNHVPPGETIFVKCYGEGFAEYRSPETSSPDRGHGIRGGGRELRKGGRGVRFKRPRICLLFTAARQTLRGRDKFRGKVAAAARNTVRISKIPNESGPEGPSGLSLSRARAVRVFSSLFRGTLPRFPVPPVAKTWFRVSNEPGIPYKVSFSTFHELTTVCNYLHL